jgi:hypothetical protein
MKSYEIAKKLKVKIKFDKNLEVPGRWEIGKTILINPKKATEYVVLHEIGHSICGYVCCKEHAEYIAHGVALGLAKLHEIKIPKKELKLIDEYSGISESCAVYDGK